jgi:hypothetical protein
MFPAELTFHETFPNDLPSLLSDSNGTDENDFTFSRLCNDHNNQRDCPLRNSDQRMEQTRVDNPQKMIFVIKTLLK